MLMGILPRSEWGAVKGSRAFGAPHVRVFTIQERGDKHLVRLYPIVRNPGSQELIIGSNEFLEIKNGPRRGAIVNKRTVAPGERAERLQRSFVLETPSTSCGIWQDEIRQILEEEEPQPVNEPRWPEFFVMKSPYRMPTGLRTDVDDLFEKVEAPEIPEEAKEDATVLSTIRDFLGAGHEQLTERLWKFYLAGAKKTFGENELWMAPFWAIRVPPDVPIFARLTYVPRLQEVADGSVVGQQRFIKWDLG